MTEIKDTFAVLGLSKFGYRTAVSLYKAGAAVIAVDIEKRLVQKIAPNVTKAVTADLMDWEVLEHIGVLDVDVVVIALRASFDVATLLTYKFKQETKVKKIIAQVDTEEKAEALRLLGADMVVFPEKDMADRTVNHLLMPNLVEHIALSPDTAIIEVPVPRSFLGKSLVDLQVRTRFNVHIVGIKHHLAGARETDVTIAPPPDMQFTEGDTMLLLGDSTNLNKFVDGIDD